MCDYSLELYRAVPAAAGEQYADLKADQFGSQRRQPAIVAVRPAIFHLEVAALCQTVLLQAFAKGRKLARRVFGRACAHESQNPRCRFLRTGNKRHHG